MERFRFVVVWGLAELCFRVRGLPPLNFFGLPESRKLRLVNGIPFLLPTLSSFFSNVSRDCALRFASSAAFCFAIASSAAFFLLFFLLSISFVIPQQVAVVLPLTSEIQVYHSAVV